MQAGQSRSMIRHAGDSIRCNTRRTSVTHALREPGFGNAKSRTCGSGNPVGNGFQNHGYMRAPSAQALQAPRLSKAKGPKCQSRTSSGPLDSRCSAARTMRSCALSLLECAASAAPAVYRACRKKSGGGVGIADGDVISGMAIGECSSWGRGWLDEQVSREVRSPRDKEGDLTVAAKACCAESMAGKRVS